MIKIEHPNLDKIASEYHNEIKVDIKKRCDYFLKVFDVLFNGSPVSEISDYKLNGTTRKSLTNQFLRINKLKNQKQYINVLRANCYPWVLPNHNLMRAIATYLKDENNLKGLLLCTPDDTLILENSIKINVGITPANFTEEIIKFVKSILDYSLFDKYAYKIANQLNVNTCPYCNRNYINTVIDKRGNNIIRPTFDHFFPQKHNPLLSLSFFNLIPSCYYCNSILKNATKMDISTHIHPYKEGFGSDATFGVSIRNLKPKKSDPENYTIVFNDNMVEGSSHDRFRKIFGGTRRITNTEEGNIHLFKLDDIYQSHLDIVGELVVKCDRLSLGYSSSLLNFFGLLETNKTEFYQYYFSNYFNEMDFNRRPMAKLTKEVVAQEFPQFFR